MEIVKGSSNEVFLKRAVSTAREATDQDCSGNYDDAIELYQTAVRDLYLFIEHEKCQVVVDCVLPKIDAYLIRMRLLKEYMTSRGGSQYGGSVTSRGCSSDSGVYDELDTAHNTSTDTASQDDSPAPSRATSQQPRKHQLQSRQEFLKACEQQITELLHIIQDESEPSDIRRRAEERCQQILEFAEAYRRDFGIQDPEEEQLAGTATEAQEEAVTLAAVTEAQEEAATPTVVVQEAAAAVDQDGTAAVVQLVRVEVLRSASVAAVDEVDDDCPTPPNDGDSEFNSIRSSLVSVQARPGDDAAVIPRTLLRKQRGFDDVDRIEPAVVQQVPAVRGTRLQRWDSRILPVDTAVQERLSKPGLFWLILGGICG